MFRLRTIIAFILAVLIGSALVTSIATQINLAALISAGAQISLPVRIEATLRDLANFFPLLAAILLIGYLIAFGVASKVIDHAPGLRTFGYVLAGFVTVIVVMLAIKGYYALELRSDITPVPASRTLLGLILMSLGGAGGGMVFALIARRT